MKLFFIAVITLFSFIDGETGFGFLADDRVCLSKVRERFTATYMVVGIASVNVSSAGEAINRDDSTIAFKERPAP